MKSCNGFGESQGLHNDVTSLFVAMRLRNVHRFCDVSPDEYSFALDEATLRRLESTFVRFDCARVERPV